MFAKEEKEVYKDIYHRKDIGVFCPIPENIIHEY